MHLELVEYEFLSYQKRKYMARMKFGIIYDASCMTSINFCVIDNANSLQVSTVIQTIMYNAVHSLFFKVEVEA